MRGAQLGRSTAPCSRRLPPSSRLTPNSRRWCTEARPGHSWSDSPRSATGNSARLRASCGAAAPGRRQAVGATAPARAGAPGPGAAGPGAPGGRAGGAGAPAQPPVVLSRNGKDFPATGETNVRAGTEIKVTTERPSLSLSVKELDSGSWVIFELPGFTTAASGTEQSSLDALRKASATSYYKGNGSLWVKLVSSGDVLGSGPNSGPSGGASLQASR